MSTFKFDDATLTAASLMQRLDTELIEALARGIMAYSIDQVPEIIAEEIENCGEPSYDNTPEGIRQHAEAEVEQLVHNFKCMLQVALNGVELKSRVVVVD